MRKLVRLKGDNQDVPSSTPCPEKQLKKRFEQFLLKIVAAAQSRHCVIIQPITNKLLLRVVCIRKLGTSEY